MYTRIIALAAALLGIVTIAGTAAPAAAEPVEIIAQVVPVYDGWQSAWDRYEYDRRHVMLGTVTNFAPYRLSLVRRDGNLVTIDLKNGTVIVPTGATPMPNERVAIVGYWSKGTFIANRIVLRG